MSQLKIKNGNNWESIPAGGIGVPSGGTTGQVLKKSSNTDYATEWGEALAFSQEVQGMCRIEKYGRLRIIQIQGTVSNDTVDANGYLATSLDKPMQNAIIIGRFSYNGTYYPATFTVVAATGILSASYFDSGTGTNQGITRTHNGASLLGTVVYVVDN